jgi:hypothetical protein
MKTAAGQLASIVFRRTDSANVRPHGVHRTRRRYSDTSNQGPRSDRRRSASSPRLHLRTREECGRARIALKRELRPLARERAARPTDVTGIGTWRLNPRAPLLGTRQSVGRFAAGSQWRARGCSRFGQDTASRTVLTSEHRVITSAFGREGEILSSTDVLDGRGDAFGLRLRAIPRPGADLTPAVEAHGRQDQGDAAEQ